MSLLKRLESADGGTSLEAAMEGEVREFVRRDFASVRRPPENDGEMVANDISSLLQRVSGTSVQEIDRLDRRAADLARHAAERGRAGTARSHPIREPQPGGDAVDQDHRGKLDQLQRRRAVLASTPPDQVRRGGVLRLSGNNRAALPAARRGASSCTGRCDRYTRDAGGLRAKNATTMIPVVMAASGEPHQR